MITKEEFIKEVTRNMSRFDALCAKEKKHDYEAFKIVPLFVILSIFMIAVIRLSVPNCNEGIMAILFLAIWLVFFIVKGCFSHTASLSSEKNLIRKIEQEWYKMLSLNWKIIQVDKKMIPQTDKKNTPQGYNQRIQETVFCISGNSNLFVYNTTYGVRFYWKADEAIKGMIYLAKKDKKTAQDQNNLNVNHPLIMPNEMLMCYEGGLSRDDVDLGQLDMAERIKKTFLPFCVKKEVYFFQKEDNVFLDLNMDVDDIIDGWEYPVRELNRIYWKLNALKSLADGEYNIPVFVAEKRKK